MNKITFHVILLIILSFLLVQYDGLHFIPINHDDFKLIFIWRFWKGETWLSPTTGPSHQGWGQFHFFNSIPIPIPLFSIPIPILRLAISFNSNSNSRDFNSNSNSNSGIPIPIPEISNPGKSNSNSNSGDFKSRQSHFWKWSVDVFLEIDYNYT